MKKFVLMHFGFEKPTAEIMKAWGAWFESVAEQTIENCGFMGGREISAEGRKDLPWGEDSSTGYTLLRAESMDAAVELAKGNPYIKSIRIYEIREM